MTHLDDRQLLERFDRRLTGIEAEIPMPPPWRRPAVKVDGPGPRFGGLVFAARIVAAVVVVALVGSFLLASVLTTQTSEDVPLVGASPSTSPQATYDPLSRLQTEEVAPGVLKVVADGAGRDPSSVRRSIATSDGSVWVASSGSIYDISEPTPYSAYSGFAGWLLDLGADGTLWAASADSTTDCCKGQQRLPIRYYDGESWVALGLTTRDPESAHHPTWPPDYIVDFAVHPDGTLWQTPEEFGDNEWNSVQHLGPNGWVTEAIGKGLPDPEPCVDCGGHGNWSIEITPDGTVWLGTDRHGLMRLSGEAWEVVRLLGDDRPYGVISLAASRDGVVWVEVQGDRTDESALARLGEERFLARFDGGDWAIFDTPPDADALPTLDSEYHGPSGIEAVGPGGAAWLTDSDPQGGPHAGTYPVSFDGERWTRYPEVLAHWMTDPQHDPSMRLLEMGQWHIAVAPDGTAWANVDATVGRKSHGGVYVIRPGAPGTPLDGSAPEGVPADGTSGTDDASRTSGPQIMVPTEIPDGIDSGTFDSPLGTARWVQLRGDHETLPGQLDPVPVDSGGFVTLDFEAPQALWRSPDLLTWISEPLPVEARYGELTSVDGVAWLTTSGPTGLWASSDTYEWSEITLSGLAPPAPDGFAWRLELGTPLAADGVTILPFRHFPDYTVVSRALSRPDDRDWYVRRDKPGLYTLEDDRGKRLLATVRFESIDGGLRVVDIEGDNEMAFLDGLSIEFIERLTSHEGIPAVQGMAIIDEDGLADVELPDAMRVPWTRFIVDDDGFASYGLGEDGLVYVYRSDDGRDWVETNTIGDDPGEPTDIVWIYQQGPLVIESEPHITEWTTTDGVTWESRQPPDEFRGHPVASGWLWIQQISENLPWDSRSPEADKEAMWFVPFSGEPVLIDTGGLDLSDLGGSGYGSQGFISANTMVTTQAQADGGRRVLWVVTFDELPS